MDTAHEFHLAASVALPHERLDAFQVAIELVEMAANIESRKGAADALDQLRRASSSVALNIAEACGKRGRDRARYFEIARGSALESAAALRVLCAFGVLKPHSYQHGRALCARLYAMLTALGRKMT